MSDKEDDIQRLGEAEKVAGAPSGGFPTELHLSASVWPSPTARRPPGDLSSILDADPDAADIDRRDPIRQAPQTEHHGGVIYSWEGLASDQLDEALKLLGIYPSKEYAAFAARSRDPQVDGYLDQIRFVPTWTLRNLCRASEAPPIQTINVREAVHAFVVAQRAKWLDKSTFSQRLSGLAGGDGDGAKEDLGFGIWAESPTYKICRVWSRAWLVLK